MVCSFVVNQEVYDLIYSNSFKDTLSGAWHVIWNCEKIKWKKIKIFLVLLKLEEDIIWEASALEPLESCTL